jgi:hypothetical protein
MSHVGVNLTKVHVWSVTKGPLGECNRVLAEREALVLFWKQLQGDESADVVIRDAATYVGIAGGDARCLGENYLDGAFWPDFPDFAADLRAAAVDGIWRALVTDKRFVTVITQLPDLPRPWVKVIELYTEVVLEFFLPAAPIDPT